MVAKRKIAKIAKIMFKNSLKNGQLDNGQIRSIVSKFVKLKPEGFLKILKAYEKLIETKIAREEIIIESTSPLDKNQEKEILTRTKAKITHGDWIYEASLDAKLKQLTINN